jgi:glycosyltransferase involved in cell wall biosynthesis
MLKARGHTVFFYGHEDSRVACDEHVAVVKRRDLDRTYGDHDWRKHGAPEYRFDSHVYKTFYAEAVAEIQARKEKNDFLLCTFGINHKTVAEAHSDLIICEPSIGYPDGGYARFRVFESYSIMHAYLGQKHVQEMSNEMWYDVVIPSYFDFDHFDFSLAKDDYFLFIGRLNPGKGVHIAMQIVEAVGGRLVVAGPGTLADDQTRTERPISEYIDVVGVAGLDQRRLLLSRAKATLMPSTYLEPFGWVQIESMLSGTPIISTDWGAFTEYNIHGVTGYRCRTFEHFTWAARNIHNISAHACRSWAAHNFSLERVADMYDEYFYSVQNIFNGNGWYHQNMDRKHLDWLRRYYPPEALA